MIAPAMGWIGTLGTISAYVLLSRGRRPRPPCATPPSTASAGLLAAGASAAYGAWPSVVSNLLWPCLAVHSAVATLHARRTRRMAAVTQLPVRPADPEPPTGPQPVLLDAA